MGKEKGGDGKRLSGEVGKARRGEEGKLGNGVELGEGSERNEEK